MTQTSGKMATPMTKTFLTILTNVCAVSSLSRDYHTKLPTQLFATKTAYDISFSDADRKARESVWSHRPDDGCHPVQISMVIRHGTRYPSSGDTVNAVNLMQRIAGKITNPELIHINEWEVPFQQFQPRALSPVGVRELYQLGKRIRSGMNDLFSSCPEEHILLQSSSYDRAIDSSKAFKDGFIADRHKEIPLDIRDDILRYYDDCPKHIHEVLGSKYAMKEFHLFKKGSSIKGVAERMQNKLGIHDETFSYGTF